MDLAGHGLAPPVRVLHRVDGEQRRLGLHVVDIRRVADARIGHRRAHPVRDLLHHRRPTDILRQDRRAQGGPHGEAQCVFGPGLDVAGEDGRMGGEHAVAAARPDHGDYADFVFAARAVLEEDAAEGAVRQDAGEVVDPAVALRLADDGDDGIRRHAARRDEFLQARGVRDRFDLDLRNVDRHVSLPSGGRAPPATLRPKRCAAGSRFRRRRGRV